MSATATSAATFKLGGDIEVTRLGFGAMRITGDGIWGPPKDRDAAIAVLKRLPELGVDLIDTADAYGPEDSENLIHEALHPFDGIHVATKGGYAPRPRYLGRGRAPGVPAPVLPHEPAPARCRDHRPVAAAPASTPRSRARSSLGS